MFSIRKFDPVDKFSRDLNRWFWSGTGLEPWQATGEGCIYVNVPRMDVSEQQDRIVVQLDLPGMEQKDIQITMENNVMTIAGERKIERDENKDLYFRAERCSGKFSRSFTLPSVVNGEKIEAIYKNGVLEIVLPKREETKPRQVTVKVN